MTTLLDHLKGRFVYDRWANLLVARVLAERGSDVDVAGPLEQVSHVLRAADVWKARMDGTEVPMDRLWRAFPLDEVVSASLRIGRMWEATLAGLDAAGLEEPVTYRNSRGETFRHPPSTILAHVANHGTHHRAQAVRMLRDLGVDPPATDWIAWVREEEG